MRALRVTEHAECSLRTAEWNPVSLFLTVASSPGTPTRCVLSMCGVSVTLRAHL